jgi:chromosomal replication initiation ATPase DnaA
MKGYKWNFNIEKGSREAMRLKLKKRYEAYDKTELNKITDTVASVWGIEVEKLKVQRRFPELVHPRQVIMTFAKLQHIPLWFIVFFLGFKDHSNIIHGVKAVSDRCDTEPDFLKKYNEVKNKLKTGIEVEVEQAETIKDLQLLA